MDFQIRIATPDDAKLIYEITQAAFSEYRGVLPSVPTALGETLEETQQSLKEGGAILAVSSRGDAAGTARYKLLPNCFYIGRVAVLPSYRRQGLGGLLMNYLENLARQTDKAELRLGTRQTLPGNVAFYRSLGYAIEKIEPYPAPIDDFNIVMTKHL